MSELHHLYESLLTQLQQTHPVWLLAGMALLPLVGVPVSPLWILAGIRFGVWGGSVAAILMGLINISAAYGLSLWWIREPMERLLARRGIRVPHLAEEDQWKFVVACRLTPGVPLVLQNYLLGCARVRFRSYLLISTPIMSLYCLAFVIFGESLTSSKVWQVFLGLGLMVVVILVLRMARKHLHRRVSDVAPKQETPPPF